MSLPVCSQELFVRVLSREQAMTNRCGHSFSLLALDMQNRQGGAKEARALERVAFDAMRETDIAGWLHRNCLGIILPTASAADAAKLGQRIVGLLPRYAEHLRYSAFECKPGSAPAGLHGMAGITTPPTSEHECKALLSGRWGLSPIERLHVFLLRLL